MGFRRVPRLTKGEVGRAVGVVADVDVDARAWLESNGAHANDLVARLIALDGGDDLGGAAGAFVDAALKDARYCAAVGLSVGIAVKVEGEASVDVGSSNMGLLRVGSASLRLVRPEAGRPELLEMPAAFPEGSPRLRGNRKSRSRHPKGRASEVRGATQDDRATSRDDAASREEQGMSADVEDEGLGSLPPCPSVDCRDGR